MVWAELPMTPENLEIENKLDLKYFNNYFGNQYSSSDSLQSPSCSSDLSTPESAASPSSPSFEEPFNQLKMEVGIVEDHENGRHLADGFEDKISIKEDNYARSNNNKNNNYKVINNIKDYINNKNDNHNFDAPCIIPSNEDDSTMINNNKNDSYVETKNRDKNLNIASKKDFNKYYNIDDTLTFMKKPDYCYNTLSFDIIDKTICKNNIEEFFLEEDPLNSFVNNGFGFECEENRLKYMPFQRRELNSSNIEIKKKDTSPSRRQELRERPQLISDAIENNFIDYTEDLTTPNGGGRVKTRKYFFDDFNYSSFSYADALDEENARRNQGNERDEKMEERNIKRNFPFRPETKNKAREESTFNKISKQGNTEKQGKKNANYLRYETRKKSDNKTYKHETSNEVKGLLTSCSILNGIWDDKKVPWNTKTRKEGIQGPTEFQDSKFRTEGSFEGGEPLGPKFFAQVCNLWPDLIVRLALDINLDTTSPDNAPDPPDPPNENSSSGFPLWSSNSNNEKPSGAILTSKCCSTEDPSCPQLPIETLVPNVCEGVRTPKRTLKDVSFDTNNSDGDAKKKHSYNDEEVIRKNKENKAIFESPKSKKPTLEELRRTCQSPICGSPRPKAPCPIAEISEFECLEGEEVDEEMLISTIERDYEEDEDIGVEGEDEEEDDEEEEEDLDEGEENENFTESLQGTNKSQNERMRRRLPEIPKNKKCKSTASSSSSRLPKHKSLRCEIL